MSEKLVEEWVTGEDTGQPRSEILEPDGLH
jgi:hypothetical protein